jgi:hypothetical protein
VLTQKNEPLLAQVGVNIDQANQQLILTYPAMDQLTLSLAPDLTQQMDGSFCTGKKKTDCLNNKSSQIFCHQVTFQIAVFLKKIIPHGFKPGLWIRIWK